MREIDNLGFMNNQSWRVISIGIKMNSGFKGNPTILMLFEDKRVKGSGSLDMPKLFQSTVSQTRDLLERYDLSITFHSTIPQV